MRVIFETEKAIVVGGVWGGENGDKGCTPDLKLPSFNSED